jgi:hypothetical protein
MDALIPVLKPHWDALPTATWVAFDLLSVSYRSLLSGRWLDWHLIVSGVK